MQFYYSKTKYYIKFYYIIGDNLKPKITNRTPKIDDHLMEAVMAILIYCSFHYHPLQT